MTGKGWLPGQTGNPGGRPKGLAEKVRGATRDGESLVRFFLAVSAGKVPDEHGRAIKGKTVELRERIEAHKWLADRGYGKAVQPVEASGPGGGPMQFEAEILNAGEDFAGRVARLAARVGAKAGV